MDERAAVGKRRRNRGPQGLRAGRLRAWVAAVALALLVALGNLLAWRLANPAHPAPEVPAVVAGLAYNAFQRHDSPLRQRFPQDAEIDADLRLLARHTSRLRTYSASEFPALPAIAARHGLRLTLGVWLDRRAQWNEREVRAAIAAASRHPNVERVIAGNETQLHRSLPPAELYAVLDRLRAALDVPVSTAEPWHVWLAQPQLARHVDFITVHLLPYWEGVPVEAALDEAMRRYAQVRERFPDKSVVIGEIGWPSGGASIGGAEAGPAEQAIFLRRFLALAAGQAPDYYLMEAVDQPWKRATEGRVGAHWGVFDAQREPKFAFRGAVHADPDWRARAWGATALGLAAVLAFLLAFPRMRLAGRLAFAVGLQASASLLVATVSLAGRDYLGAAEAVLFALLAPVVVLSVALVLSQLLEFAELFWPGSLRRRALPRPLPASAEAPFVSLHLACCNEPPEMVIATIDSLLALDWPAFEVIVVDNNTSDPARWRPVQAHVESILAARGGAGREPAGPGSERAPHPAPGLRFFHLPSWPGFKAGALNFALERTDPRARWIGVVDADYLVSTDWLRMVGGWFSGRRVGVVQSPQAHRGWQGSALGRMMNWEYDGFFRIGMHHRHERDAIVQHGTMTLIRAEALRDSGGWAQQCVCEDTELGLRLSEAGWRLAYVDRVSGTGLLPADFAAYLRQRRRWAQGAMQILRSHAGSLAGRSPLTLGQRYHFLAGWLPWIGDALHLVFSLAAMLWSLGMLAAPAKVGPPALAFVLPLAATLACRLLLVPLLYWRRVPCPPSGIAGATWAGMALSHSVARGVLAGLSGRSAVFEVTRKGPAGRGRIGAGSALRQRLAPVREEGALLLGLLCCLGALAWSAPQPSVAGAAWLGMLALQTLPYLAALGCALMPGPGAALRQAPRARVDGTASSAAR
ncbi:MAG: glycosyltransferase [Gammaproteobacteria bacterium]